VKITTQGQGHFSDGSRSHGKVMNYSLAGNVTPSPTALFFSFSLLSLGRVFRDFLFRSHICVVISPLAIKCFFRIRLTS